MWSKIKYLIKLKNNNSDEHGDKYMKIRFNSWYLLLGKILKFYNVMILIKSLFNDKKKYYSQLFLEECLYKFKKLSFFVYVNKDNTTIKIKWKRILWKKSFDNIWKIDIFQKNKKRPK